MNTRLRLYLLHLLLLAVFGPNGALAATGVPAQGAPSLTEPLPQRLSETGLYEPGTRRVQPGILSYSPQYPLWSDGATKRRWFRLPPGGSIDVASFDAWEFPPGTRFWKEFSHDRPVETRLIERLADGSWRYAAYVWADDGNDAYLAPVDGIIAVPAAGAPGGRYRIPAEDDCRACHEGGAVPVLGVSALQLSPDRDPLAPNAEVRRPDDVDLGQLAGRGLLANLRAEYHGYAPRVPAASTTSRAALGYLHGNCGHCHNATGSLADIGLVLLQDVGAPDAVDRVVGTTVGQPADSSIEGLPVRIVAGRPEQSQLLARMLSRNPNHRMPPLGTRLPDAEAVQLIEEWIQQMQDQ
ncbi:MAG: hypothetical protein R3176_02420 [Woeseiaceae bacterium]|nr:hypothetical protein [Woeseiaceae bacterium]